MLDDDRLMRRLIGRELGARFDVVEASGYTEAIEALANAEVLDAVVSDRFLGPGRSGLDFLIHARESRPSLPRVMASGTVYDHLTEQALSSGLIDRYVAKPWQIGSLLAAVLDVLDEKSKTKA